MYGFKFNNHLNLKRILSDYGFTQHPLKKSFPVIGFFQLDFSTYQGLIIYNTI
jgi:NADH-quinone oxidoreductase subunit C